MRAGKLRHQITIKANSPVYDEYNRSKKVNDNWQPITNGSGVWSAIEPLQGRELERAREIAPTASHKITMRYLPGVTPKMQAYFESDVFDINAVLPKDMRKIELTLYVTEAVAT